jgi:S1-C subfamily serine protease
VTTPITHAIAGGRDSYADIVDVVSPAVVTIRTTGKARVSPTQFQAPDDDFFRQFFGEPFGQGGQRGRGSRQPRTFKQRSPRVGRVRTTDGYILTNNHVVDGADEINIELSDGRTLDAKVIGTDKPSDLALLKVGGLELPRGGVRQLRRRQGRRRRARGRQPARRGPDRDDGDHQREEPIDRRRATAATKTSCRPTRRSITATRAARS